MSNGKNTQVNVVKKNTNGKRNAKKKYTHTNI